MLQAQGCTTHCTMLVVTPIVRIVTYSRVLIHMTQVPDMVWKMALLTAQMPYQANGNSAPARHSSL